jgi:hypothetical protein
MRNLLVICIFAISMASIRADEHARAGRPQEISCIAASASREKFTGGYVGGTRLVGGDGRGEQDGTWGWDYVGRGRFLGRIFLGWAHDRKHQEKVGKYDTDGRRVKDVLVPIPK